MKHRPPRRLFRCLRRCAWGLWPGPADAPALRSGWAGRAWSDLGAGAALLGLACTAGLVAVPAQAAALAGAAGVPGPAGARATLQQAPAGATGVAPAPGLTPGVLQAVDPTQPAVLLGGRRVALHPTALRVLGPGGQNLGGVAALRAGMVLRFALEPASSAVLSAGPVRTDVPTAANPVAAPGEARRIVLIYVDSAP